MPASAWRVSRRTAIAHDHPGLRSPGCCATCSWDQGERSLRYTPSFVVGKRLEHGPAARNPAVTIFGPGMRAFTTHRPGKEWRSRGVNGGRPGRIAGRGPPAGNGELNGSGMAMAGSIKPFPPESPRPGNPNSSRAEPGNSGSRNGAPGHDPRQWAHRAGCRGYWSIIRL
jgi:hypothetical protein